MIELRHLKKSFNSFELLTDVNAVINDGDVISLIGASGVGKSTLLRCMNLLEKPTGGSIILDGEDITEKGCDINAVRRRMGMVFQNFALFEHLTVIENIMLAPMKLLSLSKQEAYDKAADLLKLVGLYDKLFYYPDKLSSGQKQRVAIARTLAMDPEILLFDQATSSIDRAMVGEVHSVIQELIAMGKTMVMVTNEYDFVKEVCNRVFYLDEGGIYEEGTPTQIFENPKREKTRLFIHGLNMLDIEINTAKLDFPDVNSKIDAFCERCRVSHKTANKVRAVFEELCRQILIPTGQTPNIKFSAEYKEKSEKIHIAVSYGSRHFEPSLSENDLAFKLLKGICEIYTYSRDEGRYANRVDIVVK